MSNIGSRKYFSSNSKMLTTLSCMEYNLEGSIDIDIRFEKLEQ